LLSKAYTSPLICNAETYSTYLDAYSMKYGNEYDEYVK
jgi:hypothetical protein